MQRKKRYIKRKIWGFLLVKTLIFFILCNLIYSSIFIKDDILSGVGVRAAGMAGAFSALSDDFSSFFWNPGGLILTERQNLNIFYDFVFRGNRINYGLNYTFILPENMSASVTFFKNTYTQSNYENRLFFLTYSTFLDEKRIGSGGINFKFINSYFKGYDLYSNTVGIDMGFMYFPDFFERKIRFGILIQDIDTVITWNNNLKEKIPILFKMGIAYKHDELFNAALDLDFIEYHNKTEKGGHLGIEKWFINKMIGNFGFRCGVNLKENYDLKYKLTFGFSYGREDFILNYVYIPDFDYLGETHKIDFSYFIGEKIKTKYDEEIVKLKEKPEELEGFFKIITDKLKTTDIILSTRAFSPNGDDKIDKVFFKIKNYPSNLNDIKCIFEIRDKNDNILKQEQIYKLSETEISWDGKIDNNIVKEGDYYLTVKFLYKEKEIKRIVKTITVDLTPPLFDYKIYPKIFAPVENSKIKNMQIMINSKYRDIESWNMYIKNETGNIIKKYSGNGFVEKIIWDGKDALENTVKDGKYTVELFMKDFAGNEYGFKELFTVDTYISNFKVSIKNRLFKIGKNKINFIFNFNEPEKIKKWDFEILDLKNNIIKSYENKGPGVRMLTWDGTNEKNEYQREGEIYKYRIYILQKNEIELKKEGFFHSEFPEFTEVGMRLTLAAIDFSEKSNEIPVEEYTYLNQGVEALKQYAKNYMILIKGYATDYEEDHDKNLELSIARVLAVKDYLIKSQNIAEENIYVNAYGDGEYFDNISKEEIEKCKRRVEIELITK